MLLWLLQAIVFWSGMDSIRKFIDWAGPAVYVVMFAMAVWLIWKAGWQNIDLNLSGVQYDGLCCTSHDWCYCACCLIFFRADAEFWRLLSLW